MVEFRCWYCNRKHKMPHDRIGSRFTCACSYPLRVPRYSGGKCRIKSVADWAVEAIVYGGGGALLGLCLGLLAVALLLYGGIGRDFVAVGWILVASLTSIGLFIGLIFGERGINWIGRLIRSAENDD